MLRTSFVAGDDIETIHRALVLGVHDYASKIDSLPVIGLSGGIDSAVVAALACEALGQRNLWMMFSVALPFQYRRFS